MTRQGQATATVATRVEQLRKSRSLSQQRLGELCEQAGAPHINRSVIANLESGRRETVSVDELFVLARVLDVAPIDFLASEHEDEQRAWARGDENRWREFLVFYGEVVGLLHEIDGIPKRMRKTLKERGIENAIANAVLDGLFDFVHSARRTRKELERIYVVERRRARGRRE